MSLENGFIYHPSELIKKVKCFIEKNLPRCKLVTEGFHRLLAEYKPLIIHAK
jgi:hypothetical protein